MHSLADRESTRPNVFSSVRFVGLSFVGGLCIVIHTRIVRSRIPVGLRRGSNDTVLAPIESRWKNKTQRDPTLFAVVRPRPVFVGESHLVPISLHARYLCPTAITGAAADNSRNTYPRKRKHAFGRSSSRRRRARQDFRVEEGRGDIRPRSPGFPARRSNRILVTWVICPR